MHLPVLVSAPTERFVTVAEAKDHINVKFPDHDLEIRTYLDAAIALIDGHAGTLARAFAPQTWRQDFDGFEDQLRLPLAPVQSITQIQYIDADGATQNLPASVYELREDECGPFVRLSHDQEWPDTLDHPASVSVTYLAGYEDITKVPNTARLAVMQMVGHWYEHRNAVDVVNMEEVPMSQRTLLVPLTRTGVGV